MGKIVLVTGGRRSGKSQFAEKYALGLSESPIYLASGIAVDEEFARRIEYHREHRDKRFQTREEALEVKNVISSLGHSHVILWECLTMWLSNCFHAKGWFFSKDDEQNGEKELGAVIALVRMRHHTLVVVTNEIGLGVVPGDAISRRYSDVLGRYNQYVASVADEVYFLVSGIPWRLK
ncbi:MAG: bifunctional adenosylcobinamide kinase/adenosylcobinamide-phosphate guanylyltransferase [Brevinematales bacterium]